MGVRLAFAESSAGANGEAGRAALSARIAALVGASADDRTLLARADRDGTAALPKSGPARNVAAEALAVGQTAGAALPAAPAFDAALADAAVLALREISPRIAVSTGTALAYALPQDARFSAFHGTVDARAAELLLILDPPVALKGEAGGVAIFEAGSGAVAGVRARSAAAARLCAQAIAQAVLPVAGEPTGEAVFDALSRGARVASALKTGGHLRAAVLSLRGRGRVIGPMDGDRLLRFGVSDWR